MLRYSRYIITNLAESTLFIASSLTCLIWLTQSLRFVDLIVNQGLEMLAFTYLTTMLLPSLLGFMLPIALAISVMFTYHKLQADSELIVLRSAGLSRWQLARPALQFSAFIVVIGYIISLYLLPISYRQYKEMQAFAKDNYAAVLLQENVFNSPAPGLTVFIRERHADGTLRGILVHDNRNNAAPMTMLAEQGQLMKTPTGPSFKLINGSRQEINYDNGQLSFLSFDEYVLDMRLFTKQKIDRRKDEKERFLFELIDADEEMDERERAKYLAEFHHRIVWPLQNAVLALFVCMMLLSGQFNRRGNLKRYVVTLVGVGVLLALHIALSNAIIKHPYVAALLYLIPMGVTGAGLFVLLHNQSTSPIPDSPPAEAPAQEGEPS
ncbi:MAG: LPS export ABC transporter permease LptF [Alphaproteobacteria bacterium]|nr:LPS export ABC transporter permease LptF [Alphaproteobacteria bacterium]